MVEGARAPKWDRSGVIVREAGPCCGLATVMEFPLGKLGTTGLGVDQENAAAFGWLFCEDRTVAVAGAVSQSLSIGFVEVLVALPFTSRSKSISESWELPLLLWKALFDPKDIKSSLPLGLEPFAPESS